MSETLPLMDWLPAVEAAVRAAGRVVMDIYAQPFAVQEKADHSPVTQADLQAEAALLPVLRALRPALPVVSEEEAAAGLAPAATECFWLVDPLDGTREFVQRNGEFTVNVALIVRGRPVLGVVGAPALAQLYSGVLGQGAWMEDDAHGRRSLMCRTVPAEGLTVVASRSHGDAQALQGYLAGRSVARQVQAGSSLKLCLLAAGQADLYPRFGRTMEWDIAAGHAVLAAAGGHVEDLAGQPLRYGKPGFENPDFVARGRAG